MSMMILVALLLGTAIGIGVRHAFLFAQLPFGMQHCFIRFLECPEGHGRLTAKNWTDNGCHHCEIKRLRAQVALHIGKEER